MHFTYNTVFHFYIYTVIKYPHHSSATIYFLLISCMCCLFSCSQADQQNTAPQHAKIPTTVIDPDSITTDSFGVTVNTIDKNIRSIFQDKMGRYWFGTNSAGVFCYDTKSIKQITHEHGLADNQVQQIQEDELGNIWFGSGNFNVSKLDGISFTTFTQSNNITTIQLNDNDWKSHFNDPWFYAGGGVFTFRNQELLYLPCANSPSNSTQQKVDPFQLTSDGVYKITKDKKGNLWFGTQSHGVCCYNGKSLSWFTEKGLAGPAVLALFEDSKGNMWFGNNGSGLFRYDGKSLVNITSEKGLNNADFRASGTSAGGTLARVYDINEDDDGNIWIGTVDSGVWKYDGNTLTNYTANDGLTSNAVNTIFKDNHGELWFGTDEHGIFKFNGARFYPFII